MCHFLLTEIDSFILGFGWAGPLLLCVEAATCCGVWAPYCSGFSCCGAQAWLATLAFVCAPFSETNPLITDVISQKWQLYFFLEMTTFWSAYSSIFLLMITKHRQASVLLSHLCSTDRTLSSFPELGFIPKSVVIFIVICWHQCWSHPHHIVMHYIMIAFFSSICWVF